MMTDIKKEIGDALRYDGLQEAENITGKSYKDDKLTESLGFINHINHSTKKSKLLSSVDDTMFSETTEEYYRKVSDKGFVELLKVPFKSDGVDEMMFVMFHYGYSILLVWDTSRGQRNSGKMYYNWIPDENYDVYSTESGGYIGNGEVCATYSHLFNRDLTHHRLPQYLRDKEPKLDFKNYDEYRQKSELWSAEVKQYINENNLIKIWSGSHDGREALKFNIDRLVENGRFIDWICTPFLWLLHHGDTKDDSYDYKKINNERLAMLPDDVLSRINFKIKK